MNETTKILINCQIKELTYYIKNITISLDFHQHEAGKLMKEKEEYEKQIKQLENDLNGD